MISSAQNPLIKEVRRLQRERRAREAAGLFVVEGIQGVVEAVESGAPLRALLWCPERLTSARAQAAIAQAAAGGVRVEPVAATLFGTLSARENPVGILALVERRLASLEALPVGPRSLFVALYEVADPGNLGTVLRTVDAVGGDGLILVGNTVDPLHPSAVKASASTIFALPIAPVGDVAALLAWAAQHGIHVVAASDQGAAGYWSVRYPAPLLLLMGSEAHGLPATLLAALPHTVQIPMQGRADSLNLGIATALLLYEVARQRSVAAGTA